MSHIFLVFYATIYLILYSKLNFLLGFIFNTAVFNLFFISVED